MNPKLLLCLALVLGGGLFGCATNPHFTETKVYPWISFNGKQLLVRNHLWDIESGKEIRQFPALPQMTSSNGLPHGQDYAVAVAFSPDGKRVLIAMARYIGAEVSVPGPVQLWDIGSGRKLLEFEPEEFIRNVQFLPDGKHILATSSGPNYPIQVWDAKTGRRLLSFPDRPVSDWSDQLPSFSPDGRLLATENSAGTNGHYYGIVNIWNAVTGQKTCTIADSTHNFFDSAQFSPDGKSILIGEHIFREAVHGGFTNMQNAARFWDVKTGRRLRDFGQDGQLLFPVGLPLFTLDGHNIISGGTNSTITLRNAKSGKEIRRFVVPGSENWWYVEKIFLSRDGKRLVAQYIVSSGEMAVALWNVDTGELIQEFDKGPAMSGEAVIGFSPTGENFLLFDQNLKPELIDGATGKRLRILEQYQQP